ncbi:hypothetical protein HOD29_02565 [archaeon]|jgi:hypothetical protein|nr:hypothetical protein [archaeon]
MKTIIITKKEILSFNPCKKAREYVEEKLGKDKEEVSIEVLYRIIQKREDWVSWLLTQNQEWTIPLIELGANIHLDDDYTLQWASYHGCTEVVKLLIEHLNKTEPGYLPDFEEYREATSEELKVIGAKVIISKESKYFGQFVTEGEIIEKNVQSGWVNVKTENGYKASYRIGLSNVEYGACDLLIKK